jgi:hypothetical protein
VDEKPTTALALLIIALAAAAWTGLLHPPRSVSDSLGPSVALAAGYLFRVKAGK